VSGDPEVLVFAEAAALLRCSASTLLDCIHDGSVPAFRLGRGWRFYRADLMAIGGEEAAPVAVVRAVAGKRRT
jgi:excisionase family DNA binding protein